MDTILRLLSALGEVPGARIWTGSTTTDANGDWMISFTGVTFLAAPVVLAAPVYNTTTVTDMIVAAAVRSVSTTQAIGTAVRGANMLALGPSVRRASAGVDVAVVAIGSMTW